MNGRIETKTGAELRAVMAAHDNGLADGFEHGLRAGSSKGYRRGLAVGLGAGVGLATIAALCSYVVLRVLSVCA